MTSPAPISHRQRKHIWALAGELGWDGDMLHGMIARWVGRDSLSGSAPSPMTAREADRVIDNLTRARDKLLRGRDAAALRRARDWPLADDAQGRYIDSMCSRIFRAGIDGFRAWLSRQPWCGWDIVPQLDRPSDIRDYLGRPTPAVIDAATGEVLSEGSPGSRIVSDKLIPALEGMDESYARYPNRPRRFRRRRSPATDPAS